MCIKIVKSENTSEFNPFEPLEYQVDGAKEVVVNYDPADPTISNVDAFVDQMERLCYKGISCNVDIRVNANNNLNGIKLERKIEKLKEMLATNEVIKSITKWHADADRKLCELSELCMEKADER